LVDVLTIPCGERRGCLVTHRSVRLSPGKRWLQGLPENTAQGRIAHHEGDAAPTGLRYSGPAAGALKNASVRVDKG
jgi:hypothetical protein